MFCGGRSGRQAVRRARLLESFLALLKAGRDGWFE